jgi:DnaJ-class molecular chaperone
MSFHQVRSHSTSLLDEIDQFFARVEESWIDRRPDFFAEWQGSHRDLSVEITLTPLEAKKGCEIPLEIPFWADCRRCRGMGYTGGLICGFCRGRGREKIEKKIQIKIPAGVKNGMEIRFPLMDSDLRRVDLVASLRVSR